MIVYITYMVRQKKQKKNKVKISDIVDFIELLIELVPGRGLTLMLLLGAVCGGLIGYDMGFNSVEKTDCPIVEECPIQKECEICEECKNLDDYSEEELITALKPKYYCNIID